MKLIPINGRKIPDDEFNGLLLLIPALTLEQLIPKLQDKGYRVMVYRNSTSKKPYQLGVYSMALDIQEDEEKIKEIAGRKFNVQGLKNAEEIIIKLN